MRDRVCRCWYKRAASNLLFDTGTAQAAQTGIVPSLNAMGVRRLDKLILSHHDSDHDGGLDAVSDIEIGETLAGQPEFYPNAKFRRSAMAMGRRGFRVIEVV